MEQKPTQHELFDYARNFAGLRSDAALATRMGIPFTVISKLRNGRLSISYATILRLHEHVGIPVSEIRSRIK